MWVPDRVHVRVRVRGCNVPVGEMTIYIANPSFYISRGLMIELLLYMPEGCTCVRMCEQLVRMLQFALSSYY